MSVKSMLNRISLPFTVYVLGSGINLIASYALMVFLLNVLTKAQYGQYGFLISLFSMLLILFNFGHKEAVFKYASINQGLSVSSPSSSSSASASSHASNQSLLSALMGNFYRWNALILLGVHGLLLIDVSLYFVAMMFLCNSWLMTFAGYFRGASDYNKDALALPLQRLLWLLFSIILYYSVNDFNLTSVFISALMASVCCVVWLYLPVRSLLPVSLLTRKADSSRHNHLPLLVNFLLIEIASVFYLKSDVLLLRFLDFELASMADYFFAIQVFEIAVLVLMPVGYFYFNRVNLAGLDKPVAVMPSLLRLLALVVLMQGAVWLLAPVIFPLWVPKYTDSITTIVLMMFSLYPVAVNILLSSLLIAHSKERRYAKICLAALVFNIIANGVAMPNFGLEGAIAVKFFTEALITIALIVVTRQMLMSKEVEGQKEKGNEVTGDE